VLQAGFQISNPLPQRTSPLGCKQRALLLAATADFFLPIPEAQECD